MDRFLTDIIERMCDTADHTMEAGTYSAKTISWIALREAEKVSRSSIN